ncbi:MAG: ATP-binding protein [Candidatus Kryptoniota bacterium]
MMHETISFKSNSKELKDIERSLKTIFRKTGLSKVQIHDILVSTTEAISNAIQHGNKNNPDKTVGITVDSNTNTVTVTVEDEGEGFEPSQVPNPVLPENLLKPSGRGIHIMKSLMDSVDFEFTPHGTKTILKMHIKKAKS